MIFRVGISNQSRIENNRDQAEQQVINLPTPVHLCGRDSHQWEESKKDTEMQRNCKSKEKQNYSQMSELSCRRDKTEKTGDNGLSLTHLNL